VSPRRLTMVVSPEKRASSGLEVTMAQFSTVTDKGPADWPGARGDQLPHRVSGTLRNPVKPDATDTAPSEVGPVRTVLRASRSTRTGTPQGSEVRRGMHPRTAAGQGRQLKSAFDHGDRLPASPWGAVGPAPGAPGERAGLMIIFELPPLVMATARPVSRIAWFDSIPPARQGGQFR
jgi:hypothetical protein